MENTPRESESRFPKSVGIARYGDLGLELSETVKASGESSFMDVFLEQSRRNFRA